MLGTLTVSYDVLKRGPRGTSSQMIEEVDNTLEWFGRTLSYEKILSHEPVAQWRRSLLLMRVFERKAFTRRR